MNEIYKMKLHQVLDSSGALNYQIIRVAGGWIYRFSELNQVIMPDGKWSENYLCDSVFVPFNSEFAKYLTQGEQE